MPELTRFRKNARRIRNIGDRGSLNVLPLEVLSALQLCATSDPLFPNLGTLDLWTASVEFIPFIPLFLSRRTTVIKIGSFESKPSKEAIASIITTFPALCPNLREIDLPRLPRDPVITAAVSGMLLASNRGTLRSFHVDSPLTEEAREAIYNLPDLCGLSVVIEKDTLLPPLVFPNVVDLIIEWDHDGDWLRVLHRAELGKLETATFHSGSEQLGNFLETFQRVALAASAQNTLSEFYFHTSRSWNPNYPSLHPFTQLTSLVIESSCSDGCSSTVDDDVIVDLARTMPKLENLALCDDPCDRIRTGVTAKGLVALAHHCPDLYSLQIHFQVASLSTPPANGGITSNGRPTALRRDCALTGFEAGETPMPEESVLVVAMTLARIFPRINYIHYADENWEKVMDAICLSREIVDCSSEKHSFTPPTSFNNAPSPRSRTQGR